MATDVVPEEKLKRLKELEEEKEQKKKEIEEEVEKLKGEIKDTEKKKQLEEELHLIEEEKKRTDKILKELFPQKKPAAKKAEEGLEETLGKERITEEAKKAAETSKYEVPSMEQANLYKEEDQKIYNTLQQLSAKPRDEWSNQEQQQFYEIKDKIKDVYVNTEKMYDAPEQTRHQMEDAKKAVIGSKYLLEQLEKYK